MVISYKHRTTRIFSSKAKDSLCIPPPPESQHSDPSPDPTPYFPTFETHPHPNTNSPQGGKELKMQDAVPTLLRALEKNDKCRCAAMIKQYPDNRVGALIQIHQRPAHITNPQSTA